MTSQTRRINKAGLDIFWFKPWVTFKNRRGIIARRKHVEHVLYSQPVSTDYRFSAENLRIAGNTLYKFFLLHVDKMMQPGGWCKSGGESGGAVG